MHSCIQLVKQIYYSGQPAIELTKEHVSIAINVVSRLYPPANVRETFALLAALNLLNAAVKTKWGKKLVAYDYIKGAAGLLFEYLSACPIDDVQIYNDKPGHITYFRVMGVQLSFHYVRVSRRVGVGEPAQKWDGIRLQLIAGEVFTLACSLLPPESRTATRLPGDLSPKKSFRKQLAEIVSGRMTMTTTTSKKKKKKKRKRIHKESHDFEYICWITKKMRENKLKSLQVALQFNPWRCRYLTLLRRKDWTLTRIIRYDGTNYDSLITQLIKTGRPIPRRQAGELFAGYLYYITPKMRLRAILPSQFTELLAQNNYVCGSKSQRYNLLVSYGIARYLTKLFPTLRFACTLITNRRSIANRLFTNAMLRRVPLNSRMRRLKVWLPCDTCGQLARFNVQKLPSLLIKDYLTAEDYYYEYEIVSRRRGKGIYAYRRHHLLKPVYKDIEIFHYHAYVQRHSDDLWAIYSLHREQFVSNFIYTRIWYDHDNYIIYGDVDGTTTVIHDFFNPQSNDFY